MTSSGEALALFDIDDDDLNAQEVTTHLAPLAHIQMPTFPQASLSPSTSKTHIRPPPGGHSPSSSPLPSPVKAGFGFGVTGSREEVSVGWFWFTQVEEGGVGEGPGSGEDGTDGSDGYNEGS